MNVVGRRRKSDEKRRTVKQGRHGPQGARGRGVKKCVSRVPREQGGEVGERKRKKGQREGERGRGVSGGKEDEEGLGSEERRRNRG